MVDHGCFLIIFVLLLFLAHRFPFCFPVTPLADYYIIGGGVYQAPDLGSVLNSRLVSANICEISVAVQNLFGWFKRSLNQSIGSFSTNPHFALFRPDRRSDIFGNLSNHWGMVTYTFFWNNFFGSLIRACTGSFANVSTGTSPLYIKVGQILELSENGSWVLVDARRFFFVGHN